MPHSLEPINSHPSPQLLPRTLSRRTTRALSNIEHTTLVRMALVQAEGLVQTEKLHEVDALTREAITGQALLNKWRDTLAGSDPLFHDELKFFSDTARLAKGELLADLMTAYCRESRS